MPPAALLDLPHLEKLDLRWTRLAPLSAWLPKLEVRGCLVYT